jgi:hypothetical protein
MQPTPTDSLADLQIRHSIPYSFNETNTLVTQATAFLFGMDVGRAQSTMRCPDQHVVGPQRFAC